VSKIFDPDTQIPQNAFFSLSPAGLQVGMGNATEVAKEFDDAKTKVW
jgi:hypothetical protein